MAGPAYLVSRRREMLCDLLVHLMHVLLLVCLLVVRCHGQCQKCQVGLDRHLNAYLKVAGSVLERHNQFCIPPHSGKHGAQNPCRNDELASKRVQYGQYHTVFCCLLQSVSVCLESQVVSRHISDVKLKFGEFLSQRAPVTAGCVSVTGCSFV